MGTKGKHWKDKKPRKRRILTPEHIENMRKGIIEQWKSRRNKII